MKYFNHVGQWNEVETLTEEQVETETEIEVIVEKGVGIMIVVAEIMTDPVIEAVNGIGIDLTAMIQGAGIDHVLDQGITVEIMIVTGRVANINKLCLN